jgi:hypothetical protein
MEGEEAGRDHEEAEHGDIGSTDLAPQPLAERPPAGDGPSQTLEVGGDLVGTGARRASGMGVEGVGHVCLGRSSVPVWRCFS